MSINEHVISVCDDLFYRRGDPNDVRLGEVVIRGWQHMEPAQVVVLGCPQDEGVCRNKGRAGAAGAPAQIRRALYRYPLTAQHRHLRIADIGDIRLGKSLEETHAALQQVVTELLRSGKTVVVLGGGNDISYPDCAALASTVNPVLVLNIDRHLDIRADAIRNSGTPYRQLLDEKRIDPAMFHEIGINSFANSQTYLQYALDLGVHVHYLGDVRALGAGATVQSIVAGSAAKGIFYGFDLDVVRAIDAPGVSDPSPMGLTAREVCEIADVAAQDPRTRLIEISEVNPIYDNDGITCKLAANIIMRALAK